MDASGGVQAIPATERRQLPAWVQVRLWPAILLAAGLTILGLGAWFTPDPHGLGTHRQLGLPPCGLYATTGLPCPTCGMTTTFALAVHGNLANAFINQPAGFVMVVGVCALVLVCAWALVSGMSLAPLGRALNRPWVFVALGLLLMGAWGFKIGMTLLHRP